MLKELHSVGEVIDALGGNSAVMEITGAKSSQAVCNWRRRRKFPPRLYPAVTDALRLRNMVAPRRLWGMTPPDALSA